MSVELWRLHIPIVRHISDAAEVASQKSQLCEWLANISFCKLAAAAHFNQVLRLWCIFGLFVINRHLYGKTFFDL